METGIPPTYRTRKASICLLKMTIGLIYFFFNESGWDESLWNDFKKRSQYLIYKYDRLLLKKKKMGKCNPVKTKDTTISSHFHIYNMK